VSKGKEAKRTAKKVGKMEEGAAAGEVGVAKAAPAVDASKKRKRPTAESTAEVPEKTGEALAAAEGVVDVPAASDKPAGATIAAGEKAKRPPKKARRGKGGKAQGKQDNMAKRQVKLCM
jgi:hypothetical protein